MNPGLSTATVGQGTVETLPGSWAPPGSREVELVFRTVGERTSDLALELALQHIRPQRAHVIRDVKPWSLALARMLQIDHRCSQVVYVDADCLILEDMRPFLDANDLPFVDCFVHDRFRGRIHCGVHITRADVVRAMGAIAQPVDSLSYVLRPEGGLRRIALRQLGLGKQFKSFHILHDHFQRPADVFVKYARRELRSRKPEFQRRYLEVSMSAWGEGVEFDVARLALAHAASAVPPDASAAQVEAYLHNLPRIAEIETSALGWSRGDQVGLEEVHQAMAADPANLGPLPTRHKVFGLGLSRTGTRSLTAALHVLGFDTVHYPTDPETLETLARGDARFSLLEHYDGITDITVAPYYEDLDRAWPGAKFVLTVRDAERWLPSCRTHWARPLAVEKRENPLVYAEIQRFLRAAVYGCYEFDEARFRRVYRRHVESVTRYFSGREDDLLVLDVVSGEGYERLAPFLGMEAPDQPFPHEG